MGELHSRVMEESAEVLRERCATYKEQLQQVESALAVDSGNEQMIKLRIDLMQVIELTSELLGSATQEPEGEEMPDDDAGYQIGSIVSAWYQASESWEAAEIDAITSEGNYAITYVGWPSMSAEMKPEQITRFKPTDYEEGAKVMAVYESDGMWYHALIKQVEGDGYYKVVFDKYGAHATLKSTHLKLRKDKSGTKRARGIREVPDSLKVLLTDTEEQKSQKKKKVKAIKAVNRQFVKDEEQNGRQNNWKSFQAKPKKRMGFFVGRNKNSMFQSPNTVDGKVGVVMHNENERVTDYADATRIWTKKDE